MFPDKWFEELVPLVLPPSYEELERHNYENGIAWRGRNHKGSFVVIMTGAIENDRKRWLHVSVARLDKLPEWELLKEVKQIFIGCERQAIQVLPKETEYTNLHPYCLHLFCCVDTPDPVPNFVCKGFL